MARNYRQGRLGEEIRKIVANMILLDLKDPRLKDRMVSVTDVEVTSDGSYATVYLTILGKDVRENAGQDEKKEILDAMKSASGYMRTEIGRNIKLRHVPELRFKIDSSLEYGHHMSKIMDDLNIPADEEDDAGEEQEHGLE